MPDIILQASEAHLDPSQGFSRWGRTLEDATNLATNLARRVFFFSISRGHGHTLDALLSRESRVSMVLFSLFIYILALQHT